MSVCVKGKERFGRKYTTHTGTSCVLDLILTVLVCSTRIRQAVWQAGATTSRQGLNWTPSSTPIIPHTVDIFYPSIVQWDEKEREEEGRERKK
jgi:hypothetical protein